MNHIYQSIWNAQSGAFVAASEHAASCGRKSSPQAGGVHARGHFALKALAASMALAFAQGAWALPTGGVVSAGSASIAGSADNMTITQTSQNASLNWQGFSIGQGQAVKFVQPNSSSVALNRVLGSDPSSILGSLSANGKVFLVNPNGILFGKGAQVDVGGLVASALNITDSDFMAGKYKFSGSGTGSVVNQGAINANGGYVALLGRNVGNEGLITANLGTVALAAGTAISLDLIGDGLLKVIVNEGAVDALVQNGGLIRADGGQVVMTTQALGSLLKTVVNNTGIVQAQTLQEHNGTIMLLAGMQDGTVDVGGTLDASAPNGGNGGFIETSAAHVQIANDIKVTTQAPGGVTGTWLIDPLDFIVAAAGGNTTGAALSLALRTSNVTIDTNVPGGQNGDIWIEDAVTWTAVPGTSPTTLTMNAVGDVNVGRNHLTNTTIATASITAVDGSVEVCCGGNVNVYSTITTTRGSMLLAGGGSVTLFAGATLTTTDGNMMLCAGDDVIVDGAITLTRGSSIAGRSLGLPFGLTLMAGTNGTGPGIAGGTVLYNTAIDAAVTGIAGGPLAPVTVIYNPLAYATPTDYSGNFTLVDATLTQKMLVFPQSPDKPSDGTTSTTLTSLKQLPPGVTLVNNPGSTANFNTAAVGAGKLITFTGYSLAGANAADYALPLDCCGPARVGRTTGNIIAGPVVVPGAPGATAEDAFTGAIPLVPFAPVLVATTGSLSDLNVLGTGVRMPDLQLAELPAPIPLAVVEAPPAPVVVLAEPVRVQPAPPVIVPVTPRVLLPPRQDRN